MSWAISAASSSVGMSAGSSEPTRSSISSETIVVGVSSAAPSLPLHAANPMAMMAKTAIENLFRTTPRLPFHEGTNLATQCAPCGPWCCATSTRIRSAGGRLIETGHRQNGVEVQGLATART